MDNLSPERKFYMDSIAVALLIGVNFLNLVITRLGFPGLLSPIIFFSATLCIVSIFIFRKGKIIANHRLGITLGIIVIYYVASCFIPKKTNIEPVEFIAFCIIPLLIGSIAIIDYELVLKILMLFLCTGIPVFTAVFAKANHSLQYDAMALSTSYGTAPVIISGIVHFIFYGKEKQSIFVKILYCISAVFLLYYIPNSYRGPLLSVVITFLLIWMSKGELRKSPKKFLCAIVLMAGAILIYVNFSYILIALKNITGRLGINVATIDKTLILGSDLSDGRIDLYSSALSNILESPIFGHGISTFPYYTGGIEYPHNFVLQFLFDGGIVLFFTLMLIVIPQYVRIFRNKYNQPKGKIPLIILLTGIEITRAFFSGNTWSILQFWLLLGVVLNNNDNLMYDTGD